MSLLSLISEDDLELYVDSSVNKYGYNLGDFLNAPYYMGLWKQNPHNSDEHLERLNNMAKHYPKTILGLYCDGRPANEPIPSTSRLKYATDIYLKNNKDDFKVMYNEVLDDTTICVHLRTGDYGLVSDFFINIVYLLSVKYKKVILFTGIHADQSWNKLEASKNNCVTSINAILSKNTNIFVYLANPDVHLSLLSVAKNVLLHRNGFSILASLVCTGTVYVTDEFSAATNQNWLKEVDIKKILLLK
jgi:hypothetical protein